MSMKGEIDSNLVENINANLYEQLIQLEENYEKNTYVLTTID